MPTAPGMPGPPVRSRALRNQGNQAPDMSAPVTAQPGAETVPDCPSPDGAIPASTRPGRGRSRAAGRRCRGDGPAAAMAVKAPVAAAPMPTSRWAWARGSWTTGNRVPTPAGGLPPPGDPEVSGLVSHLARTRSRASVC